MSAMFELAGGGIGVMPDPQDNPDSHNIPHHDAGTRISFEVSNVGDEGGTARVGVEVDESFVSEWTSQLLGPGQTESAYVSLGRLSPGQHTALAYVNPGSGSSDHSPNTFDVG